MTEHNNITKYTEKTGTREPNLNLYIADADIQYNQGATYNFETLANVVQMSCLEFVDTLPSDAEHRAKYIKNSDKKLYVRVKPYDTWDSYIPKKGWVIFCEEDSKNYQFDGENWEEMQTGGGGSGDVTGPSGGVADGDIVVFSGTTGKEIKKGTKASGSDIDVGSDDAKFVTAKALTDSINVPVVDPGASGYAIMQANGSGAWGKTSAYTSTYDIGTKAGAVTIDWVNGTKQKIKTSGDITITFTAPACDTQLDLIIDNTDNKEITFTDSILTAEGAEYEPSNGIDILTFKYYSGIGYVMACYTDLKIMGV